MMDEETWRLRIASSLRHLGDADFQRRSWILGEGDEVSSFEEAVCALSDFDLSGFAERCVEWGYSVELAGELLAYWEELREYSRNAGPSPKPEAIVDDPRWDRLCRRAKDLAEKVERR